VRPAGPLRHEEQLLVEGLAVGSLEGFLLAAAPLDLLGDDLIPPLLEHIRAALQEQHPKDVFLELRGIHLAAQDVGRTEQVALQLGEGELAGVVAGTGRTGRWGWLAPCRGFSSGDGDRSTTAAACGDDPLGHQLSFHGVVEGLLPAQQVAQLAVAGMATQGRKGAEEVIKLGLVGHAGVA